MKKTKRPLLVGNWKMNPVTLEEAKKRFQSVRKSAQKYAALDVVICPPFPFIAPLAAIVRPLSQIQAGNNTAYAARKARTDVAVGAQDVSSFEEGSSKTGEVGARMLESVGAEYALVGHSERRQLGDTSQTVALKIQQALRTGMNIILCVGEKDRDNEGGYLEVIRAQIREALNGVNRAQFHQILIAYEPVWAIGRKDNVAITSYDLHQMVVYIRKVIREMWGDTISSIMPILYGGSVTPENAEDIMWNGEVDGLLVGRASWTAESFADMFGAVSDKKKVYSSKAQLKETLKKAKDNRSKDLRALKAAKYKAVPQAAAKTASKSASAKAKKPAKKAPKKAKAKASRGSRPKKR